MTAFASPLSTALVRQLVLALLVAAGLSTYLTFADGWDLGTVIFVAGAVVFVLLPLLAAKAGVGIGVAQAVVASLLTFFALATAIYGFGLLLIPAVCVAWLLVVGAARTSRDAKRSEVT